MRNRSMALAGVLFGLMLMGGCSQGTSTSDDAAATTASATPVAFNPSAPSLTLNVPGMTCGGCSQHVAEALQSCPGVEAVETDLEKRIARVNVDEDKFDAETAIAKLAEEGYAETSVAEATN